MQLNLPRRDKKPRIYGITSIHDIGIPIGELKNILEDYSTYLDIAKIGVGSAYITPNLHEKISIYKDYNVEVYFGGTLFEKAYSQNKLEEYFDYLKEMNISLIEISCGTVDLTINERLKIIKKAIKTGLQVVAEVGSKDAETIMAPSLWISEMKILINAGCKFIITEGRDSASAGLFRTNGEVRTGLLSDILSNIDSKRIIFEAPTSSSQMFFINTVGANVNLGNVSPRDLLILESQRQSLRCETFNNSK